MSYDDHAQFTIHTRNSAFVMATELADAAHAEAALETGVRSAVMIAAEEIDNGLRGSAVEVTVADADGNAVRRVVVSILVAPLTLAPIADGPSD